MNVWPVISREMRSEARSPFTHVLRVAGAIILVLTLLSTWMGLQFRIGVGGQIFLTLHAALFVAIWVLVPLLSADCLSRERRERTLDLLFLTPLRPRDIVVAKSFVHGLRAMTLWLAVLPVLAIPILLGGVSGTVALQSVLNHFSAICLALAAGLMATSLCRQRTRALALAAMLSGGLFLGFAWLQGWLLWHAMPGGWYDHWLEKAMRGAMLATQLGVDWSYFRRIPANAGAGFVSPLLLGLAGKAAAWALLALLVAVAFAGVAVGVSAQHRPPTRRMLWLHRLLFTPFLFREVFNRWARWKLHRNPVGWLEQRRWNGRIVSAIWLSVIISLDLLFLQRVGYYDSLMRPMQMSVAWLLVLSVAATASGSFRREMESGVLELMLISPLREREIVLGRLKGLWEQFLPAIGLLLGVWAYLAWDMNRSRDWPIVFSFAVTFATLPAVGLYFSLAERNYILALAATLLTGVVLPLGLGLLPSLIRRRMMGPAYGEPTVLLAAGTQIAVALCFWWLTRQRLARRAMVMERTS